MSLQLPYLPPHNTPLFWMDEQSGRLREAIQSFYAESLGTGTCEAQELRLVIAYIQYVIDAPCWQGPGMPALRDQAKTLRSVADINALIKACLDEGIDPL